MSIKVKNIYKFEKQVFFIVAFFSLLVFLPVQKAQASDISSSSVIDLVNKERLASGLKALTENSLLDRAAWEKVQDMIKNNYFAHTSPGGVSPWYWIEKSGYDYKYAGENLAINFSTAESQHKAWMKSATHRKNILSPNYQEIGVAVARGKVDGQSTTVVAQFFGAPVAGVVRSLESKPVSQPTTEIADEQQSLLPLPKSLYLNELSEEVKEPQTGCANGLCYFNQANELFYTGRKISEETAWIMTVVILLLSIIFNAITLSRQNSHNPFIAANTVILLIVLTGIIFWKV